MDLKLSSLVITLVTLDLNRILILFSVLRSCCWLVVAVKCRFTRRLLVVSGANLSIVQQRDDQQTEAVFSPLVQSGTFTE